LLVGFEAEADEEEEEEAAGVVRFGGECEREEGSSSVAAGFLDVFLGDLEEKKFML
jgi:hypothetical protein